MRIEPLNQGWRAEHRLGSFQISFEPVAMSDPLRPVLELEVWSFSGAWMLVLEVFGFFLRFCFPETKCFLPLCYTWLYDERTWNIVRMQRKNEPYDSHLAV